jgi:hypothetical protein
MAIHQNYSNKDNMSIGTLITAEITGVLQLWASEMNNDLKVGSSKSQINVKTKEKRRFRKICYKCEELKAELSIK